MNHKYKGQERLQLSKHHLNLLGKLKMNLLIQPLANDISSPCSICGKGTESVLPSDCSDCKSQQLKGPNDDPHACGRCSDKGNISLKNVTANNAAIKLFGFNPF
jgi:hypothetical protein